MSIFKNLDKTKYKSIKFGKDVKGGGTSFEPVIYKPIPNNDVGKIHTAKEIALEQAERVNKILKFTARGKAFENNQRILLMTNTQLESSFKNNIREPRTINIYNRNTILNQLKEDPNTGIRYSKFGLTGTINENEIYLNIVTKNSDNNNRLVKLIDKLKVGNVNDNILGSISSPINNISKSISGIKNIANNTIKNISTLSNNASGFINGITSLIDAFAKPGSKIDKITDKIDNTVNKVNNFIQRGNKILSPILAPDIDKLDEYLGGPGSNKGLGLTTIKRYYYTNNIDNTSAKIDSSNIWASKLPKWRNGNLQNINKLYQLTPASTLFNNITKESIEGDLLPESSISNITSFNTSYNKLKEQIKKPFTYPASSVSVKNSNSNITYENKIVPGSDNKTIPELIRNASDFKYLGHRGITKKFNRNDAENMSILFKLIDPFSGDILHRIIFSAYISNFRISSESIWNSIQYIGRSENLHVYNKFARNASFNLQIPCFNPVELREKHRGLGALESSLAGVYKDGKLGGVITQLYLGSYIKGEACIIKSVNYSIPDESSWDLDEKLAHYVDVTIEIIMIHNTLPTFNKDGGFFSRSILNGSNGFISSEKAFESTGASLSETPVLAFNTVTDNRDNPILKGIDINSITRNNILGGIRNISNINIDDKLKKLFKID
jgi:hypothetical protein